MSSRTWKGDEKDTEQAAPPEKKTSFNPLPQHISTHLRPSTARQRGDENDQWRTAQPEEENTFSKAPPACCHLESSARDSRSTENTYPMPHGQKILMHQGHTALQSHLEFWYLPCWYLWYLSRENCRALLLAYVLEQWGWDSPLMQGGRNQATEPCSQS